MSPSRPRLRTVTLGTRGSPLTKMALEVVGSSRAVTHVDHVESGDEVSPNSSAGRRRLAAARPDLFLSSGYGVILRAETLELPGVGAINVHPSLLPEYRGSHPVFWAMYERQPRVGVTLHEMAPRVDSGPILGQEPLEVDPDDDPHMVYESLMELAAPLLAELLEDAVASRALAGTPQSGPGSYRSTPARELHRLAIDWSLPAAELVRRWRAFPGWLHFDLGRRRIFPWFVAEADGRGAAPGRVVSRGLDRVTVGAGEGTLVELCGLRVRRADMTSTDRGRSLLLGLRAPRRLPSPA